MNVLTSCDSWSVFNDRAAELSEKEKGDAFELLVKLTLQLHPLYATKLEKVWHHHEVPSDVREQLRLPPKDKGIDLVARTFDGDYWTIQAKYRSDPASSLTFDELSTFAALSVAKSEEHFILQAKARGKFISPCGSGKSLSAYWMARSLGARRVVVAVPSLFLIGQTLRTWVREAVADGRRVDWLCVCSDESAGEIMADDLVTHVHDLGIPCETDPVLIAAKMRQMNAPVQIVLATYHSSPAFAAAAEVGPHPELRRERRLPRSDRSRAVH